MEVTHENPGPRIGWMLHALLEEVLDDPTKNTSDHLEEEALKISSFSDEKLRALGVEAKEKKDEREEESIKDIRKKYFVD